MNKLKQREFTAHVRSTGPEEAREALLVASDETVDAYDEVIDQKSWQLGRYRSNPVVLWAHDSTKLPIGSAKHVEIRDGKLLVTVKFASAEANPEAEKAWRLCKEGHLKGVSVGFLVGRALDEGTHVLLLDCTLLEVSLVAIGANPSAGVVATRSLDRTPAPVQLDADQALADLVEKAIREPRSEAEQADMDVLSRLVEEDVERFKQRDRESQEASELFASQGDSRFQRKDGAR